MSAFVAAFLLTTSPTFLSSTFPGWLNRLGLRQAAASVGLIPLLFFGLGAILLAKNPEGTVHMEALQFQRAVQRRVARLRS
jgi:hypothetical protein